MVSLTKNSLYFYTILILFCIAQLNSDSHAQEINPAPSRTVAALPPESVTREQVEAVKARIDASADLSEEAKKTALDSIQSALNSLTTSAELLAREQAVKESLKTVEETRSKLQHELDELQKQVSSRQKINELKAKLQKYIESLQQQTISRANSTKEFLEMEQNLAIKRSALVQAQSELDAIESRVNERAERQRTRKERLVIIPMEKENVQKQISELTTATESDLVNEARRLALQAERHRLEVEPTTLQNDLALASAEDAASLSLLRRQIKTIEVDQLKQEIQLYADGVNRAREVDATNRRTDAMNKVNLVLQSNDPWKMSLAAIFQENVAVIDEELEVQTKLKEIQGKIDRTEKEYLQLSDEFEQIKSRAGRTGASRSFGVRLRQQRKLLPDPQTLRRQVHLRLTTYEDGQLHFFDLRETRKLLDDIEEEIQGHMEQVIAETDLSDASSREISDDELLDRNLYFQKIEQQFRNAYDQQREYLTQLINAFDKYIQDLENYESEQLQLADFSEQVADYINERVLWIRSHDPLNIENITTDFKSLQTFLDVWKWGRILSTLSHDLRTHIILYSLFGLLWILLFASQSRQTLRLKQASKKASSRLNTSLKPTLQALLMTFGKSSTLPLPFLFLGWRLSIEANNLSESDVAQFHLFTLAENLTIIGMSLLSLDFTRNVHRPNGLAHSHFNWSENSCLFVYQQIHSFIVLVAPLMLVIAFFDAWKIDGDNEAFVRIFSIGAYLLLAITLHRLTDHKTGAISSWVQQNKNGWTDRFAALFHWLFSLIPISLAILTGIGFSYTSNRLAIKLGQSIFLLFGVLFLRAFLLRWLSMRHRRIAVEQARQTRAALSQDENKRELISKSVSSESLDQKSTLAEVSAQSRRLLNTTIVVLTLVGLWFVWTDVLPALHYLDAVALPGTTVRIPSMMAAIVVAILATTAARNVPGLLQITVLEWLPIGNSIRYAIAAVTQYIIAIVGLLAISGQLGIGWGQVQWLAAALTFGLGFGLQEIFANFVSGLIILLEQPVRVGDVVTIDGVSGKVTRIRIRSTTITDWDRKDYIVPNKEFITGKLLNWTLTDTTNRITIVVGVAYGTDPLQVHRIITQVAGAHPLLLRDPAPIVYFEAFGDSSLNFKLLAFLPALDFRLQTIHELHIGINQAFADARIEIPFPQRDLHVRSSVPISLVSNTHPATDKLPSPLEIDSLQMNPNSPESK